MDDDAFDDLIDDKDELASEEQKGSGSGTVLLLLAGVAAVGTFATLFTVWMRSSKPTEPETLRIAMDEYVAGRYDVVERLVASVDVDMEEEPDLYRQREFLIGASSIQLAMAEEDPVKMRTGIADSIDPFVWLQSNGFPLGRSADGHQLLGIGLKHLGRFSEAIAPLSEAISENPVLESQLLLPLAESKLRAGGSNLSGARNDIERLLAIPNLADSTRDMGLLLKSRICTAMRQWDEAREAIDEVDNESLQNQVDVQEARIGIAQARTAIYDAQLQGTERIPFNARVLLDDAIGVLGRVIRGEDEVQASAARLLESTAYRLKGDKERALSGFAMLHQNNKQPAEATIAALEEVELLAEMANYRDALLTARSAIRDIADPRVFDPKWMNLAEFRTRLESIAEIMRNQGAFAESIELARILPPVVPLANATRMRADSHRRWAEQLQELAVADSDETRRNSLSAQSRAQFREAGRTYEEVAKLQFTEPEYVQLLWDAIESYQHGRAFEESLELLDNYLRYEERTMLPRGLIAKGQALLAMGEIEKALVPLTDCVEEFPRDALRYDARLLKAKAQLELGLIEEPRRLLESNLYDGFLSPESPAFRDSTFVLGDALYRQALRDHLTLVKPQANERLLAPGTQPRPELIEAFNTNQLTVEEAIQHLEESRYRDLRYKNIDRARRTTYLLAQAHRLASFWPGIQAADPDTIETTRRQLNSKRIEHLTTANEEYSTLKRELTDSMEELGRLGQGDRNMLRNCFMGVADTYYDLGELENAVDAYQSATQEYMNEPLALEAMMQQALCYDKLNDHAAARRIYQQAADVLKRIPIEQNQNFARTTRYDRKDWEELIGWLQQT